MTSLLLTSASVVPMAAHAQVAPAPPLPQPTPPSPTSAPPTSAPIDNLDLDAMPDVGVAWPDLNMPSQPLPQDEAVTVPEVTPTLPGPALPSGITLPVLAGPVTQATDDDDQGNGRAQTAESDALATIDPAAPLRYHVSLNGFDEAANTTFYTRFDSLSVLKQGEGDRANIAQIRRRGQSDQELVDELLRGRGYYDSRTRLTLGANAGTDPSVNVTLGANSGQQYLLSAVEVFGLEASSPLGEVLRPLFPVKLGDPADTDAILAATDKLRIALGDGGYPFADVRDPVLTVDHQQREAILNLNVNTGGFRRFGEIKVNGDAPFSAEHISVISRFSPGDPYSQSTITDLNRALVATGLVSQVTINPVEGKDDSIVDLAVTLAKAPPRTISGEIGYGTGEGARIEASWQHRNFFPPEGALTVRGVLGTQEQSVTTTFRRNNLGMRDRALNVELVAANVNQPAYKALTAGIGASIERQTNIIFQKAWTWSAGGELRISDERDLYGDTLIPRRRTYVIAALPTSITYDGSDDLLDPHQGFRLGARISPEVSLQDTVFSYVRGQVDGSAYVPITDAITIAGRTRIGTIVGASADRIAPTRRFYAGGSGSVRGYSYQAIGPRDLNNDPVGGRSLAEFSLEARIRFGSLKQFGIVPFLDAGTISSAPLPKLRDMRVGAGFGLRYYSNFGPIRVDVGTPINPQAGDPRIGVYVSLGQAF